MRPAAVCEQCRYATHWRHMFDAIGNFWLEFDKSAVYLLEQEQKARPANEDVH